MIDNDWGILIRVVEDDEAKNFPKTDVPSIPDGVDAAILEGQVAEEEVQGHPALVEEEPDYEPVDTEVYD